MKYLDTGAQVAWEDEVEVYVGACRNYAQRGETVI